MVEMLNALFELNPLYKNLNDKNKKNDMKVLFYPTLASASDTKHQ